MKLFLEFLRQKVPKAGKEIPAYFRRALTSTEILLAAYYAVCFLLCPLVNHVWEWVPGVMCVLTLGCLPVLRGHGVRLNLFLLAADIVAWVSWSTLHFGWSVGAQHILVLILVFAFFNVYEKPVYKIVWFFAILAVRIVLFYISNSELSAAAHELTMETSTVFQVLNTVAVFLMLASTCIIFSTNIQGTERQLRLKNQSLYKEAGTDPLTGLPNRRSIIEQIEKFCKTDGETFSVAIADIDYFKNVNDTYGHNCGDYTLTKLTELFVEHSMGRYSVCRWGGEEFCFFMPGMNLDEAGVLMKDLCFAVEKMKLNYEENEFSITVTIGVEEYDFSSPLEDLLNTADEKLYMGKNAGRNQVVV